MQPVSAMTTTGPTAQRRGIPGACSRSVANDEVAAPVLGPRGLVVTHGNRLLLAEADGRNAGGIHAEVDQVALGRLCTALAQREVVLLGAALVAVALDLDRHVALRLEERRVLAQSLARVRAQ